MAGGSPRALRGFALVIAIAVILSCTRSDCPVEMAKEPLDAEKTLYFIVDSCQPLGGEEYLVIALDSKVAWSDWTPRELRKRAMWSALRPILGFRLEGQRLDLYALAGSQFPTGWSSDGPLDDRTRFKTLGPSEGLEVVTHWVFPGVEGGVPPVMTLGHYEMMEQHYRQLCHIPDSGWPVTWACSEYRPSPEQMERLRGSP